MKRTSMTKLLVLLLGAAVVASCGTGSTGSKTANDEPGSQSSEVPADSQSDGSEPDKSDGPEPTDDAGNEAPAVQGISSDKVIKLGAWAPLTGPLAGAGLSTIYGGELALNEANAAGGINGYTFEVVVRDDASDPTRTVRVARSLWEDDEVFALFLPYGSSPNQAARDYILENQIPLLFYYGDSRIYFTPGETPPEDVFGFYPPYGSFADMLIDYSITEKNIKNVGVVYTQDLYGQAGADGTHAAAEKYGLDFALDLPYASTETNYDSIGRKIAKEAPDAMVAWAVAGITQIMKAADESGYKGLWLVQTGLFGKAHESKMIENPSLANRTYLAMFERLRNDGDPEIEEFFNAFADAYPKQDADLAAMGWTQGLLLTDAVGRATADGKPLTWPALRESLNSTENLDVGAGVGIGYNVDNHFGSQQARIYKWDGSQYVAVTDFQTLSGLGQ